MLGFDLVQGNIRASAPFGSLEGRFKLDSCSCAEELSLGSVNQRWTKNKLGQIFLAQLNDVKLSGLRIFFLLFYGQYDPASLCR